MQVAILNETSFNIFRNFVANKTLACHDNDPIWINMKIKSKIKSKNEPYKICKK